MTTPSSSSVRESGRRRARRDAADIGVMTATADKEQNPAPRLIEHRRNDRHVRQVRAAVERVVERHHVARLQRAAPVAQHRPHALAHRAEMHRHMRRIGHQRALGVEDRAAKIQPLLDVHAHRGVLQHRTGLLGDVHEQIVEQLQQHRIGTLAVPPARASRAARCGAAQMIERGDLRLPLGLDHRGRVGLADQRRSRDPVAGQQIRRDRTPVRRARPRRYRFSPGRSAPARPPRVRRERRLLHRLARRDRLDRDRLHDDRPRPAWRSRTARDAPR